MTKENESPNAERVVAIIQARVGSSRLPGKSLLDLAGAPLVGRVLERIVRCKEIAEFVLAIPDTEENYPLREIGQDHNVTIYAGAENDLLDRYYQAAKICRADIVVRFPADNPVPEPEEIDRIIRFHRSLNRRGFTSNLAEINGSGYPDGIGAEVFDFTLLEQVWSGSASAEQREHVHLNFYDYASGMAVNENWCPVHTLTCPPEFRRPDIVLDVNVPEQYKFMRQLYEDLYPQKPDFNIIDIIQWYDSSGQVDCDHRS